MYSINIFKCHEQDLLLRQNKMLNLKIWYWHFVKKTL